MNKDIIQNILKESKSCSLDNQPLVFLQDKSHFESYFTSKPSGCSDEKIISDESLFRDYSRLGNRNIEFEKVRNPFTVSKFTIGNYEKTWYYKNPDEDEEGPFNSHEMDNIFKQGKLEEFTKLSINIKEFFRLDYFLQIVYPLPRSRQKPYKKVRFVNNFSNVDTEIISTSNMISKNDQQTGSKTTPFKKTPFKNIPTEMVGETFSNTGNKNMKWNTTWSTSKKINPTTQVKIVQETFLVKSQTKNRQKFKPNSSYSNYKLEMSDIIGNYTAIKKDADKRQYIDLSKKMDFTKTEVSTKKKTDDIDLDFDNFEVSKND